MQIKRVDFSKFSSIRVGGERRVYLIENEDEVFQLQNFQIIGGGNNILVSPNGTLQLAQLSKKFDFIKIEKDLISIGGATPNGKIFNFAKREDISGFEFLQHIPSTLGGMVKMNAGLKGYEIFNNLVAIKTEKGWIEKGEIDYSYRHTDIEGVIFEAKFQLLPQFQKELISLFQDMRSNQPKEPSAGSTFKNPKNYSAGKLLEDVGLKGFRLGDMQFSPLHANFLINIGGGKFDDAIKLIELGEKRVFEEFGVELEREICVIY